MRKLVVGTFVTLDGVMQAPGGPNEDRDSGFQHGGWLVPYCDEKFGEIMTEWTKQAGAFLLGRKTYEMFAASWPNSTDPADESAMALNTKPKFVASRTLDTVSWNDSHLGGHQKHQYPRRTHRSAGQTDCRVQRPLYPYSRVRTPSGHSGWAVAFHQW
jgi:dihydrofolate reductase